jgi:hypothetical protein
MDLVVRKRIVKFDHLRGGLGDVAVVMMKLLIATQGLCVPQMDPMCIGKVMSAENVVASIAREVAMMIKVILAAKEVLLRVADDVSLVIMMPLNTCIAQRVVAVMTADIREVVIHGVYHSCVLLAFFVSPIILC